MVTEKMVEAAQKAVNTRHGLTDIEMRKALEAALSTDAEPVAYRPSYQQIKDTVQANINRMHNAGESHLMMARWLSADLDKLYPPQPAPSVAVKALAFEADNTIRHANKHGITTFSAKTPFGAYLIRQYPDGRFTLAFGFSGELWEHHSTFETAIAAAQADYEARIRSALSAQVQDVAEHELHADYLEAMADVIMDSEKAGKLEAKLTMERAAKFIRTMLAAAPAAKLEEKQ